MSRTRQILELASPTMKATHERLTGLVQACGYCSGNGWLWGRDECGEGVKAPCPVCGGSGRMQPVVTVEWKPVINK